MRLGEGQGAEETLFSLEKAQPQPEQFSLKEGSDAARKVFITLLDVRCNDDSFSLKYSFDHTSKL